MATDTIAVQANRPTATQVVFASDPPIPTLITNTSLTGTIFLSEDNSARTVDQSGLVPLGPNGSIVVDGTRDFYAVTASATPIIVATVSGGLATFLGITQGLGSLVLSAIFSPNFITGVSGWSINKDGRAEFNNLTIRGTFFGVNFILNSSGLFIYSGTPGTGNLLLSISPVDGTDGFGNSYDAILSIYGAGSASTGAVMQFAISGGTQTIQKFITHAASELIASFTVSQVNNAGAANESMSLYTYGPASTIDGRNTGLVQQSSAHNSTEIPNFQVQLLAGTALQTVLGRWDQNGQTMVIPIIMTPSGSNPATIGGKAVLIGLASSGGSLGVVDGGDGVVYATERKTYYLSSTPLAASPGTNVISHPALSGRNYRIQAQLYVTVSGAAQQLFVGIGVTGGTGHIGVSVVRAAVFLNASDFTVNTLTGVTAAAALAVGNTYIVTLDGTVSMTATGVINFTMAGTNANDLTVGANSYIDIVPG